MTSKSFKIALWAFIASLVFITIGLIEEITIGSVSLKFQAVEASIIMALLAPALGLYGWRRHVDAKYLKKDGDGKKE